MKEMTMAKLPIQIFFELFGGTAWTVALIYFVTPGYSRPVSKNAFFFYFWETLQKALLIASIFIVVNTLYGLVERDPDSGIVISNLGDFFEVCGLFSLLITGGVALYCKKMAKEKGEELVDNMHFLRDIRVFQKRPHLIPAIIAGIMLFLALAHWPYGYYQLLRFVVCGMSVYIVFLAYSWEKMWPVWLFGFIALLFNPLISIHLSREIWQPIDVICAILFAVIIFALKNPNEEKQKKKRILIISREPNLMQALQDRLEMNEYHVTAIEPYQFGNDCCDLRGFIKKTDISILGHYYMPEPYDGDYIRHLLSEYSDMPIILMTSHTEKVNELKSVFPSWTYLVKPFDLSDFVQVIENHLSSKKCNS